MILEEWSNNIWQRDLCNDTSYKSAFLFKNILENYDHFEAMGYWSLSDHMEEIVPSSDLFMAGLVYSLAEVCPKAVIGRCNCCVMQEAV